VCNMVNFAFINKKTVFITIAIVIMMVISVWVRILPLLVGGHSDLLSLISIDDPLYNLRQVEQILANYPNYAWFDPMTLFPIGGTIKWGPVFPFIIATVCLMVGATTRPEIIAVSLLVPPVMAAAMVPVMYYIGKICGDWKTGLLSAFFITIVSGQYFNRSFYGYMDHHIAEVLFSAIFCLAYMYTLYSEKNTKIVLRDINTYKKTIFLSVLTGCAYLLGLLVMPTMILFAMIVAIFTVIQFIVDGVQGRSSEYLVILNSITFVVAIIGLLLFGFKSTGIGLISYTVGHVYAYLILIGITVSMYVIYVKFGQINYFKALKIIIISAAVILIAIVLLSSVFKPLYELIVVAPIDFFGQRPISSTILESMPWSTTQAWATFNFGILLMFSGVLIMLYKNFKEEHPHFMFGLVWALIVLVSTWQHVRYEYYLAVPLTLVSAICVSSIIDIGLSDFLRLLVKKIVELDSALKPVVTDKKKIKRDRKDTTVKVNTGDFVDYIIAGFVIIAIVISGLFAYTSFSQNYGSAVTAGGGMGMNSDWVETANWMNVHTPDPGVNYTQIYDKATFKYPPQAYGVMSWWDYGHLLTYIAKRIPNANPFQEGVEGPNGSASFFIAPNEQMANTVLDNEGTRYVVTDFEMDSGKFWAMATWYNQTLGYSPYQVWVFSPRKGINSGYDSALYNTPLYYSTMISRLHTFDGSLVDPQTSYYVEYADSTVTQVSYPVISNVSQISTAELNATINDYNSNPLPGYHAIALSPSILVAPQKIPALQHYRLVHESPYGVFPNGNPDMKHVKTFEYVKGAHITGNGTIQVMIVTNTGRHFVYQQESVNGEWVVPYSTTDTPYEVKTEGKYKVVETGAEYDVPESAVMQGAIV
jgi:oligosaccharyl transferase (archaeosortase A-associated)